MIYLSKLSNLYRITPDEAWRHKRPEVRNRFFAGLELLFPSMLKTQKPILRLYTPMVNSAWTIFNHIKDRSGSRSDFHFDGEAEIYFPPELLHVVAELAGARKKKQGWRLTATEKAKLVQAGKEYRFNRKPTGRQDENPAQI